MGFIIPLTCKECFRFIERKIENEKQIFVGRPAPKGRKIQHRASPYEKKATPYETRATPYENGATPYENIT